MRPIKFRAWDKATKEMVANEAFAIVAGEPAYIMEKNGGSIVSSYLRDLIPMQFTGLQDKNGTDIYEGDIFNRKQDKRHPSGGWIAGTSGFHPENSCVVTYSSGAFWCDGKLLCEFVAFTKLPGHGQEVIGNIYENPELLEVEA